MLGRLALGTVLGAALLYLYQMPGYPDEFAYVKFHTHGLTTWPTLSGHIPQCTSAQNVSVPLLLAPGETVYALLFAPINSIAGMRALGLILLVAWLALIWKLAHEWSESRSRASKFFMLAISVIALGVQPLMHVLIRPETSIAIVALALFWTIRKGVRFLPVFLLLTSVLMALHPKALFFFPLLLTMAYFAYARRSKVAYAIASVGVLGVTFQTVRLQTKLLSCDQYPQVKAYFSGQYLDASLVIKQPSEFITTVMRNWSHFPVYVRNLSFTNNPDIAWLPSLQGWSLAFNILGIAISFFIAALGLDVLVLGARRLRAKSWDAQDSLAVGVLIALASLISLQIAKGFYESPLILFLLLTLKLLLSRRGQDFTWSSALQRSAIGLAVLSLILLVVAYPPGRLKTYGGPNTSRVEEAQSASDLASAVRTCGLNSPIVVDDLTFLSLRSSGPVYFATYLGVFRDAVPAPATGVPIGGFLLRCSAVPARLRDRALQFGELCCSPTADF